MSIDASKAESPAVPAAPRLSLLTKLVYGSGDWGMASFGTLRQIFYAIFLTDVVGLNPGLASFAALFGVIWDAINDICALTRSLGLGTLLNLKPSVELREGVITTLSRVRTWSRAVADLADRTRALAPLERLAIMHTHYMEGAREFLARVCTGQPCPPNPLIVNATTVIGAHVGPHALGIAAVVGRRGG